MLRASTNRLHRRPHVFICLHQVPARRQKRFSVDLSTFIDSLCISDLEVAKHLSPSHVPIALNHDMRGPFFEGLFRIQGCVNAPVNYGGSPLAGESSHLVSS